MRGKVSFQPSNILEAKYCGSWRQGEAKVNHIFWPRNIERRKLRLRVGCPALVLAAWMASACGGTLAQTYSTVTNMTGHYEFKKDGIYTNGHRLPRKNIAGTIESVDTSAATITVKQEGKGAETFQIRGIGCSLELKGTRFQMTVGQYSWPPPFSGSLNLNEVLRGSSIQGDLYQDKPHKDKNWHCLTAALTLTPQADEALKKAQDDFVAQEVAKQRAAAELKAAKQKAIADQKAQQEAQRREMIAAWRANGSKVDPPEEAQRHKVLAEEAFKEKNLQKAVKEYSAALDIYPTWPEGQFNLALMMGELQNFAQAADHMSMYLELDPNAADAQEAKERIWVWQDKAGITVKGKKK